MIKTIADLLNDFIRTEVEILNEQDIRHPTTIGAMFEGLTEEIMHRSVFDGLNLKVVKNSFIEGCTTEFDILLVEGEGDVIPYTTRYKYKPEQVVLIIQVKKNLYSKDIREGFENLQFLIDYFEPRDSEPYVGRLFRDSFRSICRKDISAKTKGLLSKEEEMLFHTLRIEAFLPPRIIWGYNGFASERNFRESFVDYLKSNLTTDFDNKIGGFGPHNFPSLIICGRYSMIKTNAMPYIGALEEGYWWPFFTTSSFHATNTFLEVVWTRLSYKFNLTMEIFGEDLELEPHNRFLSCRIKEVDGHTGWEYDYYAASKKTLEGNVEAKEWKPVEIDIAQQVIINKIGSKGEIDISGDADLEAFVLSNFYESLDDFVEKLVSTGLVYREGSMLRLLTDECTCVTLPDGRILAGENKSGRLVRWVTKEMDRISRDKSDGG